MRRGRWLAALGDLEDACEMLDAAYREFVALGEPFSAALALLHRADAAVRRGPDDLNGADRDLAALLALSQTLGGTAGFRHELSALTALRGYLARGHGPRGSERWLEPGVSRRLARVVSGRLEVNGVNAGLSAGAVRLLVFLARHPSSGWSHLREALYTEFEDAEARGGFERHRAELESLPEWRVVYRSALHAYSLVWQGVSLER